MTVPEVSGRFIKLYVILCQHHSALQIMSICRRGEIINLFMSTLISERGGFYKALGTATQKMDYFGLQLTNDIHEGRYVPHLSSFEIFT